MRTHPHSYLPSAGFALANAEQQKRGGEQEGVEDARPTHTRTYCGAIRARMIVIAHAREGRGVPAFSCGTGVGEKKIYVDTLSLSLLPYSGCYPLLPCPCLSHTAPHTHPHTHTRAPVRPRRLHEKAPGPVLAIVTRAYRLYTCSLCNVSRHFIPFRVVSDILYVFHSCTAVRPYDISPLTEQRKPYNAPVVATDSTPMC